MGSLIDVVFCLFLEPILKADNISEAASQFIGFLYRTAQLQFAELFGVDDEASGKSIVVDIARKSCKVWDRFAAVGDFMQMNLSDINDALSMGKFVSITGPELSRLILATFDESEKRRKLLHALARE